MKILFVILSLVFCSFVYADFDKAQTSIIGTWTINKEKTNEEWSKFISPFLENLKGELNKDELKELEKALAEEKKAKLKKQNQLTNPNNTKKRQDSKNEKVIKITQDRFIIIEDKKTVVEGGYTLYLSRDKVILLHVYSLKHEEKKSVDQYYNVSFDGSLLSVSGAGEFMPEWYSKNE